MRNNQKVKNKNKNKKIKTKQNKKTQIPFKWILSKDTNHAFIRCYTSDHQKKKDRGNGSIFPRHIRVPSIWETMGLCLIFTFKVRNRKMWSWFNLQIHSPPCHRMVWALFQKEKGRIIDLYFYRWRLGLQPRLKRKSLIPTGRGWENYPSFTSLDGTGLVFVFLLSEDSKQCRAGGFH